VDIGPGEIGVINLGQTVVLTTPDGAQTEYRVPDGFVSASANAILPHDPRDGRLEVAAVGGLQRASDRKLVPADFLDNGTIRDYPLPPTAVSGAFFDGTRDGRRDFTGKGVSGVDVTLEYHTGERIWTDLNGRVLPTLNSAGPITQIENSNDQGASVATAEDQSVVLQRVAPTSPPVIKGTDGRDIITVTPGPPGSRTLIATVNGKRETLPEGPVSIEAGRGNDEISVDPNITVPINIDAGPGDDYAQAGGGNDALLGDSGHDVLKAGPGHDVLVGGKGRDVLEGEGGDDIQIAGDSPGLENSTVRPAVLFSILALWASAASYPDKIRILLNSWLDPANGQDDSEVDRLDGGPGQDWYLTCVSDEVREVDQRETRTDYC
jgi:Ca2+-binding RTX toxin-like protein